VVIIPSIRLSAQRQGLFSRSAGQSRIYFPSAESLRADARCSSCVVMRPSMIEANIMPTRCSQWCVPCHSIWLGGRTKEMSQLSRTCFDVLAGQNRERDDRGISHSVMEDWPKAVRDHVVFYRYRYSKCVSSAIRETTVCTSQVVLLYNQCISYRKINSPSNIISLDVKICSTLACEVLL
jgi:hypothetical protein